MHKSSEGRQTRAYLWQMANLAPSSFWALRPEAYPYAQVVGPQRIKRAIPPTPFSVPSAFML